MRRWVLFVCVVIATASPCVAQLLWYGGDSVSSGGFHNNTSAQDGSGAYKVIDDFVVPAGTRWHVTSLFSNNVSSYPLALAPFTHAVWSIRTGVSVSSFGTVLHSGVSPVTITPTGRPVPHRTEYTVTVSGLSIDLEPGTYFMTVSPLTQRSQNYYVFVGSTVNVVGIPGPDTTYDEFEESANPPRHGIIRSQSPRASMGVIGTATGGPGGAPATAPALSPLGYALLAAGLAIAGLLVMRRL